VRLFLHRSTTAFLLFGTLALASACVEGEGGAVRVSSLKFNGVKAVKAGQLKSVLATAQSSKLPWGDKHYFTASSSKPTSSASSLSTATGGFPMRR